jgi:hypothetical protein
MSGGHFDYNQYRIYQIADEVEQLILTNRSTLTDEGRNYSAETIDEFHRALYFLHMAAVYTHRIDWLVSGDDGEDSFHARLEKDKDEILCKLLFKGTDS